MVSKGQTSYTAIMTYRHADHAGNRADIAKHLLLLILIRNLQQLHPALTLIDSHAGDGFYPMAAWQQCLLVSSDQNCPDGVKLLLQKILYWQHRLGSGYTGSPLLLHSLLREQDQLHLYERDQSSFARLQHYVPPAKNVTLHHTDAFNALTNADPLRKSTLLFIDPPYVEHDEAVKICSLLNNIGTESWPLVWYPIDERRIKSQLRQSLSAMLTKPSWLEVHWRSKRSPHMQGCGLLSFGLEPLVTDAARPLCAWLENHWQ